MISTTRMTSTKTISMNEPLVTIIISSYNRPKLIRDALDSILGQTWPNIQLIVADDFSDQKTRSVIADCGVLASKKWARFNFVQPPTEPTDHDRQFGQRCAIGINAAMKYAVGDFVAFLPDDDYFPANSIEVRARYLIEHPDVNVVYGRLEACHVINGYLPRHSYESADLTSECDFHHWIDMPEGYRKPTTIACHHDRNGFWSADPVAQIANRCDHGQVMVRRVPNLPQWPEVRTQEVVTKAGQRTESCWDGAKYVDLSINGAPASISEAFDCDDAGYFYRLEMAGLGPFHSVPDVVVVKRYHELHHRTDPSKRE